jgi:hypothetical protein
MNTINNLIKSRKLKKTENFTDLKNLQNLEDFNKLDNLINIDCTNNFSKLKLSHNNYNEESITEHKTSYDRFINNSKKKIVDKIEKLDIDDSIESFDGIDKIEKLNINNPIDYEVTDEVTDEINEMLAIMSKIGMLK